MISIAKMKGLADSLAPMVAGQKAWDQSAWAAFADAASPDVVLKMLRVIEAAQAQAQFLEEYENGASEKLKEALKDFEP